MKNSCDQHANLTQEHFFQQAIDHHKAGRLQDAERLYRTVLQANPRHPDANHNLGILTVQAERPVEALPHLYRR